MTIGFFYTCSGCGIEFKKARRYHNLNLKRGTKFHFCSNDCRVNCLKRTGYPKYEKNNKRYKSGARAYRQIASRHHEKKCNRCGYDQETQMLDVDHIDNNRQNNEPSNLQYLCVWCHAIKTRKLEWHPWSLSAAVSASL